MSSPTTDPYATALRSALAGSLTTADAGRRVSLGGWIHRSRNLGAIVFLDLRDRAGLVQVSFDPKWTDASVIEAAAAVGTESVVLVEGEVAERPAEMRNPDMSTGDVEVRATSIRVVGPATAPAIPVARGRNDKLPSEELRLRHRYLDLRRPELQANIVLRHRLMQATRAYFSDRGFLEVETPILTKPTPEGARDYLVPSRVHAGEFYALPQSPQLYKQLLMVAGFDRYFQIARCFRDEDLRADRQPEFTQIDVEASFVKADDILSLAEGLIVRLWHEGGIEVRAPFPRMTYREAMERYGTDRPDLRYGVELFDATPYLGARGIGFVDEAVAAGARVRAIAVPGGGELSRKVLEDVEALAKGAGASRLLQVKRQGGAASGSLAKFLDERALEELRLTADGDLCLLVVAPDHISNPALDRVRQDVARRLGLVPEGARSFLWVLDFPMFDRDPTTDALAAVHHPFTAPHPDDLGKLRSAPHEARALAYDVVLNGTELGGGSVRISDPALQQEVFGLLGIDEETAQARFGFLLEGLRSGAPPHGGIAFGFDRIAMLIAGAGSLRDVIAFPKTTAARALFEGAPTPVPDAELAELHLRAEEGVA